MEIEERKTNLKIKKIKILYIIATYFLSTPNNIYFFHEKMANRRLG